MDCVSETCRCSWDDVWQMTVLEFLNIICYHNDTVERRKSDIQDWKNKN